MRRPLDFLEKRERRPSLRAVSCLAARRRPWGALNVGRLAVASLDVSAKFGGSSFRARGRAFEWLAWIAHLSQSFYSAVYPPLLSSPPRCDYLTNCHVQEHRVQEHCGGPKVTQEFLTRNIQIILKGPFGACELQSWLQRYLGPSMRTIIRTIPANGLKSVTNSERELGTTQRATAPSLRHCERCDSILYSCS